MNTEHVVALLQPVILAVFAGLVARVAKSVLDSMEKHWTEKKIKDHPLINKGGEYASITDDMTGVVFEGPWKCVKIDTGICIFRHKDTQEMRSFTNKKALSMHFLTTESGR